MTTNLAGTAALAAPDQAGPEYPPVSFSSLDCLQVNLAVLAERWHGPGTHLRLGAPLRLRRQTTASGLPTAEATLRQHLNDARRLLGIKVISHRLRVPVRELADELAHDSAAGTRYVVADAFHLPWTPYHQRRHMSHSFLLRAAADGSAEIADAYQNDTPWGQARPGLWRTTPDELVGYLPERAEAVVVLAEAPLLPVRPVTDLGGTREYADRYLLAPDRLAALDQLCLEAWLLERSRRLHAAFLAVSGHPPEGVDRQLSAWRQLADHVYLAFRRAERGRPEPPDLMVRLAEVLRGDIEVFGGDPRDALPPATGSPGEIHAGRLCSLRMRTGPPASPTALPTPGEADPLWCPFAETVAQILQVNPQHISLATSLAGLPSWNSLRLVQTVEALEQRFSLQFDASDLVPEQLGDISYLYALVAAAGRRGGADQSPAVAPSPTRISRTEETSR
jgi:acyl carrier protein